ncbi:MAG: hypothetical protein ABIW84_02570 [Ilumatobacteraceae bacterium]
MRLLSMVTALLAVLLAVFGWIAVSRRDQSLDATGAAADRLIAVQEIRSAVIEADSIATTTFLSVGLEGSAAQRALYETRVADAAGGLALLSEGDSATARDLLAVANSTLNQFSGLVEQARANNRQGFPVGAAYQRQASALVRSDLLTSLDGVEQQARADVNDSIASAHRIGWVLPLAAAIAVAAIVAGGRWLFARTRRLLNVPLTLAAVAVVVTAGIGLISMSNAVSDADDVVVGDLLLADRFSQARVSAFEARSDEALTLINRGNGGANEDGFRQAQSRVEAALPARSGDTLRDTYDDYAAVHETLRQLDDDGAWDEAVDLLFGESEVAFDEFSAGIESSVQRNAFSARAALADAGSGLGGARVALLIGGLLAGALVAVGYGQRLREYR